MAREFFVSRTKTEKISRVFSRIYEPQSEHFRRVNLPRIALSRFVGCLISHFDVPASGYWNTHYRFESVSRSRPKHLGETTSDVLIVNAIVPLLFCYGRQHGAPSVCERAIGFLENTPAEDNTVTRHYAACGVAARNAMQSQAMLHLFECYCKRRQCLKCRIGSLLIKNG